MSSWRFRRTTSTGGALALLLFLSSAHSQDRPQLPLAHGASQPSLEEKFLFEAGNRERAAIGLKPLKWDNALAAAARQHVLLMAQQYLLSHEYPGEVSLAERAAQNGAKFAMIAENVAVGPSPESIHNGWMHSPGHRANILNAEFTAVGIATARASGGLYAAQDFSKLVADLSLEQQEAKVVSLLRGTPFLAVTVTDDARKTCEMRRGFAGPSPLYMIRFEVADLGKLPDDLMEKVSSRAYRAAAVGACREPDTGGFTRFRIAVLLH
jgi:uncharacterized protein YkwD